MHRDMIIAQIAEDYDLPMAVVRGIFADIAEAIPVALSQEGSFTWPKLGKFVVVVATEHQPIGDRLETITWSSVAFRPSAAFRANARIDQ